MIGIFSWLATVAGRFNENTSLRNQFIYVCICHKYSIKNDNNILTINPLSQ